MHEETWVLVADGARARLFRADATTHRLELIEQDEARPARRKTSDLMTDQQGRAFASAGAGQRSAMEPPTDPKRREKERFAVRLAHRLADARSHYDRLVVVAAPTALGDLRRHFDPHVAAKVKDEIDSDLTWEPQARLEEQLAARLWPSA